LAASHLRKAFNEITNRPSDSPLTIPIIGIDSKAAADIASSAKETKKTRHIERRYHYFRESIQQGNNKLFHIPGVDNWSNGLTKPETAEQGMKDMIAVWGVLKYINMGCSCLLEPK
jgi:hypothetical protein